MPTVIAYTLARLALFLVVYGLIWLAVGRSVAWDSISALYTALIAMVVSSLIAFVALRGMRERLADEIGARAARSRASAPPRGNQQANEHSDGVPELGEPGVAEDRDQT